MHPSDTAAPDSFACDGCGANVHYQPGTRALQCPYCGHQQQIAAPVRAVTEHSMDALTAKRRQPVSSIAPHSFVCQGCGAHTECDSLSRLCQFCAAPLVADTNAGDMIPPEAIVPFALDKNAARAALRTWTSSRWFAPSSLKSVSDAESTASTYVPHWTFDARTRSDYTGERGTYYYVTETYTENGETKTRQVRKTRWNRASGTVARDFDDILVIASTHVTRQRLAALEPWPLPTATAFQPAYLAGHRSLRYDVEPEAGLVQAKDEMAGSIQSDVRRDIGGDVQRVHTVDTTYFDVSYKLLLLPVWICTYIHNGKPWQVLVNGATGEVQGDRPYSAAKIAAAIAAAVAVIAAIITIIVLTQQ